MSKYKTIEVTKEHIEEGTTGCSQTCAIAWAITDSLSLPDQEQVFVEGASDISIWCRVATNKYVTKSYVVHEDDCARVDKFIDWYDDESINYDQNLEDYEFSFRMKEYKEDDN